jgi:hypothetical protein
MISLENELRTRKEQQIRNRKVDIARYDTALREFKTLSVVGAEARATRVTILIARKELSFAQSIDRRSVRGTYRKEGGRRYQPVSMTSGIAVRVA